MPHISIQDLLEAGAHFGHQTQRWNPKMKPYIFGERNGVYIIDLQQTEKLFETIYNKVRDIAAEGGQILFTGTKRQAQEIIIREARRCGMPYVAYRWVGGLLTNFPVIRKCIDRLHDLDVMDSSGSWLKLPPKELADLKRERLKLFRLYSGLHIMNCVPSAVFVVDTVREKIGILEANKIRVPVIGILDTNCDPDLVQMPIPGNDDAIRSIQLFTSHLADAVLEGKKLREETSMLASQAAQDEAAETFSDSGDTSSPADTAPEGGNGSSPVSETPATASADGRVSEPKTPKSEA